MPGAPPAGGSSRRIPIKTLICDPCTEMPLDNGNVFESGAGATPLPGEVALITNDCTFEASTTGTIACPSVALTDGGFACKGVPLTFAGLAIDTVTELLKLSAALANSS